MSLMAETSVEFMNKSCLRNPTKVKLQTRIPERDTSDVLKKEKKHVIKIRVIKPQTTVSEVEKDTNSDKVQNRGIDLVAIAKRAADIVSIKKLFSTNPDFILAMNALTTLKYLPVPTDSVRFTRDFQCLKSLTIHPVLKIRTEAANVVNVWQKKKKSTPPRESSTKCPLMAKKPQLVRANQNTPAPICPKLPNPEMLIDNAKPSCDLREKVRGHLLEALSKAVTEIDPESAKAYDTFQMAVSIESIMYKKMGNSNMAKQRSILFNLKDPKNPELRKHVLLGEIKAKSLVEMTTEEMASSKRKRENEEIRLKRLFGNGAIRNEEEKGTTQVFKCGKCGQRKCTSYQMKTTSDIDKPITTFVRCIVCSNRWKF